MNAGQPTSATRADRIRARWRAVRTRVALRSRLRRAAPFASGIVAALIGVWLFAILNPGPTPLTKADVREGVQQVLASQAPSPATGSLVYAAVQPSLVLLQVKGDGPANAANGGIGSGVVVSDQGDILTALHVVSNATTITVTFADGSTTGAIVTQQEPENDIAVLKAATVPSTVVPATLGNPGAVRVGDDAFVVGNPLGLYGSISAGVVSGLQRTFEQPQTHQTLKGLIQVDAAINPGASGGALLNRDGQVVGIVTGLINPTQQNVFIGIGLAVPIDVAGGAAGLPPY